MKVDIVAEAFRCLHTYLCLSTGRCADDWGITEGSRGKAILREMGFPWAGTPEQLVKRLRTLRKSGKMPCVLKPGMARTIQKP